MTYHYRGRNKRRGLKHKLFAQTDDFFLSLEMDTRLSQTFERFTDYLITM